MDTLKVIYIMGYGRSGSTLLDTILHQHKETYSVGALNNIYDWHARNEKCACNKKLDQCNFWPSIVTQLGYCDLSYINSQKLQSSVESLSNFKKLINTGITAEYEKLISDLYSVIAEQANSNYVIDSSKSTRDCTGRAYALSLIENIDLKVIHLVRDVRGVAWSAAKKTGSCERKRLINNKLFNIVKTSFSWWLTNYLSQVTIKRLPKDSVKLLRYEDLCNYPYNTLKEIGEFLDLDYTSVIAKLLNNEELDISHNLGGNQIRFNKILRFKPDLEWEQKMPKIYRFVSLLIAGRMNKKLGY